VIFVSFVFSCVSQLTISKRRRNISRVIMNSRRFFGYYWFGYFTEGKASLLAREFTMTSQ
jgi:hypothetical protein